MYVSHAREFGVLVACEMQRNTQTFALAQTLCIHRSSHIQVDNGSYEKANIFQTCEYCERQFDFNTPTAKRDCSRIYRSLPNATTVEN